MNSIAEIYNILCKNLYVAAAIGILYIFSRYIHEELKLFPQENCAKSSLEEKAKKVGFVFLVILCGLIWESGGERGMKEKAAREELIQILDDFNDTPEGIQRTIKKLKSLKIRDYTIDLPYD